MEAQANAEADEILHRMLSDARITYFHEYSPDQGGLRVVNNYFPEDLAARARLLVSFGPTLVEWHKEDLDLPYREKGRERLITFVFCSTVGELHHFSDEDLRSLVGHWYEAVKEDYYWFHYPAEKIADQVLMKMGVSGLTEPLKQALQWTKYPKEKAQTKDRRKHNDRIDLALQGRQDLPLNRLDPIGALIVQFIEGIGDKKEKDQWTSLIIHGLSAGEKSVPQKKWLLEAANLMADLDKARFAEKMIEWLAAAKENIAVAHRTRHYEIFSENIQEVFKTLLWCTPLAATPELVNALDEYAVVAYKKKPGEGSLSVKTGNACMYAFSQLPVKEGVSKLVKFKTKTTNNTILKSIVKMILELSAKNSLSLDELEELSVPDFGLDDAGMLKVPMGEFTAIYTLPGTGESQLVWEKEGKRQKAVPASVKTDFTGQLKSLKNKIREIEELLPVYKEKIQRSYLQLSTWSFQQWKTNYLHHPLMGNLAKRLIWHFSDAGKNTRGIWLDSEIVDPNGYALSFGEGTEVQLWHPLGFGVEEITAWRDFLVRHQITQPFRQAYREIYIVTDAELSTDLYSNRFAAHILRQHQFAALCKQRGWRYRLMGAFDSHNTPYLNLDIWNIGVEFCVDADWQGETTGPGIFTYISTDQVRFYRDGQRQRLADVPALVFSEVMRDVDLFVGVASIGNDPAWQDGGYTQANTYWHDYSFRELSESAKIREEILKGLIPRLKIAGKCTFDGRYLRVQGMLHTYKIHLGSGNILMTPDDRYLCIVRDPSPPRPGDKIFLPFEGDTLLSIILSKAILLADDDKITDTTILRQIRY